MTIIETLSDYFVNLDMEKVSDKTIEKVKLCIIDAVACCMETVTDSRCISAENAVRERGKERECTVIGRNWRTTASQAACLNAVRGAASSRNDLSRASGSHPGSVIIPAALAEAEVRHADGIRLMKGILAGYEVMIRLGTILMEAHLPSSFRMTAMTAPVGAATAAAVIRGLTSKQTASAISFASNFCMGLNEWAWCGTGEDVYQAGWGVKNGLFAADLAEGGAVGASTALEGKAGLLSGFGLFDRDKILTGELGHFHIDEVIFKQIPACLMVQAPVQAADRLVRRYGIHADEIQKIWIGMAGQAIRHPGCDNSGMICSPLQAIMSIPFATAAAMISGGAERIVWEPPYDPRIFELMKKISLSEEPAHTENFPGLCGAEIRIRKTDGSEAAERLSDFIPLDDGGVKEHFTKVMAERTGEDRQKAFSKAIGQIETVEDMSTYVRLLQY